MITFRVREHSILPGREVVEVISNGNLLAVVYGEDSVVDPTRKLLLVVSKHMHPEAVRVDEGGGAIIDAPQVLIPLRNV